MAASRHNQAVTLIEMLVVLGIMLILGGVAVTVTFRVDNESKERALAGAFGVLQSALREYYEVKDEFPLQPVRDANLAAAHEELMIKALLDEPASRQVLEKLTSGLVKTTTTGLPDLRDPWGTVLDYTYLYDKDNSNKSDNFPELVSAGPDRKFGTPDDISNVRRR